VILIRRSILDFVRVTNYCIVLYCIVCLCVDVSGLVVRVSDS